jgi:mono/diheme cytochrome c family protein
MIKFLQATAATLGVIAVVLAVPARGADEADAAADPAAAEATDSDTVARGHAIIEHNCARCHAITMEDSSHHEEAPPFRVVVTRYPPEDLAEALAEGIVSGHPDMPEFVFQPDEIEAILAYLGTLMPPSDAAPDDETAPDKN